MRVGAVPQCYAQLLSLSGEDCACRSSAAGLAVDRALSCSPLVRCGQRLECSWLATTLADRLLRRSA